MERIRSAVEPDIGAARRVLGQFMVKRCLVRALVDIAAIINRTQKI